MLDTFEMIKKSRLKAGERERNIELIIRQLNLRFGVCPESLKEKAAACPQKSTMTKLTDAAYQCTSLEDFESLVDSYQD